MSSGFGMWDLCAYSSVHDTYNTGKKQCCGTWKHINTVMTLVKKSFPFILNKEYGSQKDLVEFFNSKIRTQKLEFRSQRLEVESRSLQKVKNSEIKSQK